MRQNYYSVTEAAELLGCSVQYVHYLIKGRWRKYEDYIRFTKPVFKNVIEISNSPHNSRYMIHASDIAQYLTNKKEKRHESNDRK